MSTLYRLTVLLLIVGLLWPAGAAQASSSTAPAIFPVPGDPDTDFGGFGAAGYIPNAPLTIQKIALQPDGKIVAVGQRNNTFAVARFNSDGALDSTFSKDGVVTTTIHSTQVRSDADAVAIQPDGKIVVAGRFTNSSATGNNGGYDIAIVRYTITGTLDRTWASDGIVTSDFDNQYDAAHDVAIDSFNRILVLGTAEVGGDTDMVVERFSSNGSLDTTFSTNGKTNIGFGWNEKGNAIALQADGAIVIAGSHYDKPFCPIIGCLLPPTNPDNFCTGDKIDGIDDDFAVARLTPSGALDQTFDPVPLIPGKIVFGLGGNDCVADAVLQSDGKIVLAGERDGYGFALARLNSSGTLDSSFDGDGKLTTPMPNGSVRGARGVALQSDGRIVVAGISGDGLTLVRYTTSGVLDATFGGDGKVTVANNGVGAHGLVLQPDGRLVAAGGIYLTRYWPDGSLDSGGKQVVAFGTLIAAEAAYGMVVQPDSKIVMAGYKSESTLQFALARLMPDGTLDPTFNGDGRLTFGFGGDEVASAVAVGSNGAIAAAGYVSSPNSGNNFMIARFQPNGALSCFNVTDFQAGDDRAQAVAIQPDQKMIVAGRVRDVSSGNYEMGIVRYNANCTTDASFGTGGKTQIGFGTGAEIANAVIVQPDGKIVIAGEANTDVVLVRLTASGLLDASFGSGGRVVTDLGGSETAHALSRTAHGQLIVAGTNGIDFLLARYNSNGGLDTTFGTNGLTTLDFGAVDSAYDVAIRADGIIAVAGCGLSALGSSFQFEVAQFTANGMPDTAFSGDGKVLTSFGDIGKCAHGVSFTPNNRIVVGGYAEANNDINFALAQYVTTTPEHTVYLPAVVK
jgi:uncharacterized delta-60 repeat protein